MHEASQCDMRRSDDLIYVLDNVEFDVGSSQQSIPSSSLLELTSVFLTCEECPVGGKLCVRDEDLRI